MDSSGSNKVKITNSGEEIDPVWSPDGTKIVYSAAEFGSSLHSLIMINPDGSNPTTLVNDGQDARFATWSPDGKQIVFSTLITGKYQLDVLTVATRQRAMLVNDQNSNVRASWSPTGTIAYESIDSTSTSRVYTIAPNGTNRTPVPAPSPAGSPSWSPDGRRLAMFLANPNRGNRSLGVWFTNGPFTVYDNITGINLDVTYTAWSPFIR